MDARVITDDPNAAPQVVGPCGPWERAGPGDLDRDEAELWRLAAGDSPAWVCAAARRGPWRRIVVVERSRGSQFDLLSGLGDVTDRLAPTVCLALSGSGFHGLRQRPWEAPPGNLYLSAALPVHASVDRMGAGLSMLPAVAVVDAVGECTGGRLIPGIKWVNDLLLGGGKLAGVLSASRIQGATVQVVVVGVGLNVARAPALPWTPFVPRACALHDFEEGRHVDLPRVTVALLESLWCRHHQLLGQGPGPLLADYRRHGLVLGREVVVWEEDQGPPHPPLARGVVTAVGDDLALELRGHPEPVRRGRLALAEVVDRGPVEATNGVTQ